MHGGQVKYALALLTTLAFLVGAVATATADQKIEVEWLVIAAISKELANHEVDAEAVKTAVRGFVFDVMQKDRENYADEDWLQSSVLLQVFGRMLDSYVQRAGDTSQSAQLRPRVPPAMSFEQAAENRRRLTGN